MFWLSFLPNRRPLKGWEVCLDIVSLYLLQDKPAGGRTGNCSACSHTDLSGCHAPITSPCIACCAMFASTSCRTNASVVLCVGLSIRLDVATSTDSPPCVAGSWGWGFHATKLNRKPHTHRAVQSSKRCSTPVMVQSVFGNQSVTPVRGRRLKGCHTQQLEHRGVPQTVQVTIGSQSSTIYISCSRVAVQYLQRLTETLSRLLAPVW